MNSSASCWPREKSFLTMISHRGLSHLLLLALFLQKQRPAAYLQHKQPEKAVGISPL